MTEPINSLAAVNRLDEEGQTVLNALIQKTTDLKQLPAVARKIMQVVEAPRSTAADLERVIQADQSLTIKILKIANSSFYGLLRQVSTLQRAILVVGFKAIKDIAVSTAILNMYRSPDPLSQKMWEHSIGTGIGARLLSLGFDKTDVDEVFVAGLLHNLGKTLLFRNYSSELKRVDQAVNKNAVTDEPGLELELFRFDHTHAGGTLARLWNLAPALEVSMRCHHHCQAVLESEADPKTKTQVAIVSAACRICRHLGIGFDSPAPEMDLMAYPEIRFLQLSPEKMPELLDNVKKSFTAESRLFA